MRVLGVSSGTSLDAIDIALVELESEGSTLRLRIVTTAERPWPDPVQDALDRASLGRSRVDPGSLAALSMAAGEALAAASLSAVAAAGVSLESVDLIASHGQTVRHVVRPDGRVEATLQLGEPAVIAERTGRTVAADFRPRDIAAGGQGAPLVSFLDALLLGDEREARALQNVGGVANVTFVPPGDATGAVAFDTGPGNAVLDALTRRLLGEPYDREGASARRGSPSEELLADLLADPYFRQPPPKSLDRERFGAGLAASLVERGDRLGLSADELLATATELTARSIADAYRHLLPGWPDAVYLGGGGAANATLVAAIGRALDRATPAGSRPPTIRTVDALGLPADAKEAVAFAVLGHETLHGRPNHLPRCTGARRATSLGAIWPGADHPRLLQRVARAVATTPVIERIVLEGTPPIVDPSLGRVVERRRIRCVVP